MKVFTSLSLGAVVLVVSSLLLLLPAVIHAAEEEFTEVSTDGIDDLSSINGIDVRLDACESDLGTVPNVMFTIEATASEDDNIAVLSYPANLVTVSSNNNALRFNFNPDVANSASDGGGVKIQFPPSQLQAIQVRDANTAQILGDGFTSVQDIKVSGASTLTATFNSLSSSSENNNNLSLDISGASKMDLVSNIDVTGKVTGASTVSVQAPSWTSVTIQGASGLSVDGDVGGGSVSGASTLTSTGTVTGSLSASGASGVNVDSGCDEVSTSGASSCNAGTQSVNVDVSEKPFTLDGTWRCNINVCIAGDNLLYSCTANKVIPARDVKIGDSIRVATSSSSVSSVSSSRNENNDDVSVNNDTTICSEVYYVFHHKEELSPAIRFHLNNGSSFAVSYNHIVYIGTSFEDRRAVLSQDVKPGDKVVTTESQNDGSSADPYEVVKIELSMVDLVNVLTVGPHLEIQLLSSSGEQDSEQKNVVISAYAYNESMYATLFAPVKYIYWIFGPNAVQFMKPIFDMIDASLTRPSIRGMVENMIF